MQLYPARAERGDRVRPAGSLNPACQRLFEKLGRKTSSNHKEVFGEAFFKKLQRTPPF
ncbi:hypothetical protein SXCC_02641 [Gluconacetobacter sp. SXCC-1]|nr:hypothetical protein SXCC_02641 [Gluconacetobacter sp. SXCC-1]